MRLLSSLLKTLVLIIFGYWLAASQVASGTVVGDALDYVMAYLPVTSDYWEEHQISFFESAGESQALEEDVQNEEVLEHQGTVSETTIDDQFIREEVLRLTNELRTEENLPPLSQNDNLELAGNIRAEETISVFSHTRPNGQGPFTVLEDSDDAPNYNYQLIGENLGMATYHEDDAHMAQFIFDGWVNSQGHYENIVNGGYSEMGVGVAYEDGILYLTQFFGHPFY